VSDIYKTEKEKKHRPEFLTVDGEGSIVRSKLQQADVLCNRHLTRREGTKKETLQEQKEGCRESSAYGRWQEIPCDHHRANGGAAGHGDRFLHTVTLRILGREKRRNISKNTTERERKGNRTMEAISPQNVKFFNKRSALELVSAPFSY
jgi:hypothetical protein